MSENRDTTIRQLLPQVMGRCVYFNGMAGGVCKAGVCYDCVRDGSQKGPFAWPCTTWRPEGSKWRQATTTCEKRRMPTEAEALTTVNALLDVEERMFGKAGA